MNGWWFFLLEPGTKRSLSALRREYNATRDDPDGGDGDPDDED
jgi:hypothetical protein